MSSSVENADSHLKMIEGEQLSAVTFVRDYVQLQFDGPTITAVTRPIVASRDGRFDFGVLGYRDHLCDLIGRTVIQADVQGGERLTIDFGEHGSIVISLEPSAYRAAEAAILTDDKHKTWAVW